MNENTLLAILFVAMIGSCSLMDFVEKTRPVPDAATKCVEKAWTQADRIQCLQVGRKP